MLTKETIRLQEFLKALSRTEWYAMVFYHVEELTTSEISMVLDLPENKLKNMLSRLHRRASIALERPLRPIG
jgi:DNA-directed RNA polymerase specialized sigma24 family protein